MSRQTFFQLKANKINEMMYNSPVVDLVARNNFPRQIMLIDKQGQTLANFEYPAFLETNCGIFAGTERYIQDMIHLIDDQVAQKQDVAEVYFLGELREYERIKLAVQLIEQQCGAKSPSLRCFHVKPDIASVRADMEAAFSENKLNNMQIVSSKTAKSEQSDSIFDW